FPLEWGRTRKKEGSSEFACFCSPLCFLNYPRLTLSYTHHHYPFTPPGIFTTFYKHPPAFGILFLSASIYIRFLSRSSSLSSSFLIWAFHTTSHPSSSHHITSLPLVLGPVAVLFTKGVAVLLYLLNTYRSETSL